MKSELIEESKVPVVAKNGNSVKQEHTKFDESYMPVPGLQFTSEEEGYRYYSDLKSHKQYSLDEAGFWYIWDDITGVFAPVPDASDSSENHAAKTSSGMAYNEAGLPIYPKNDSGQPILPKDANDQPYFPLNSQGKPIFPYDFAKKQWTFPVDDTDEPIYPRNEMNKPLVPQDEKGSPIFPMDKKGNYIFPLDENNCPTPALTLDGKPVVPKDEYGSFVIPKDREGKSLIHIASDGVTPMSASEFKYYKQYYKEQSKTLYMQQQQQQPTQMGMYSMRSMFHPLNLANNPTHAFARDVEMLQRSRRVRPEDIDLPTFTIVSQECTSVPSNHVSPQKATGLVHNNSVSEASKEEDKSAKRKKFLSAQLNYHKRLGVPVSSTKKPQTDEAAIALAKNNAEVAPPISGQDLIEVVRKSISATKKAEENNVSSAKRRHSPDRKDEESSSSNHSSSSSRRRSKEMTRKSTAPAEKKGRKRRSSSDTYSSDMDGKREEISRQVISAIFGTEEYGPAIPKNLETRNPKPIADIPSSYRTSSKSTSKSPTKKNTRSKKGSKEIDASNLNEDSELATVRQCIRQIKKKYDAVKKQIAPLEKQKAVHKQDLLRLIELEKHIEEKGFEEYLSSSSSSSEDD